MKKFDVYFEISIKHAKSYGAPIARTSITEQQVPEGEDPVQYLKRELNKAFQERFANLELDYEKEAVE